VERRSRCSSERIPPSTAESVSALDDPTTDLKNARPLLRIRKLLSRPGGWLVLESSHAGTGPGGNGASLRAAASRLIREGDLKGRLSKDIARDNRIARYPRRRDDRRAGRPGAAEASERFLPDVFTRAVAAADELAEPLTEDERRSGDPAATPYREVTLDAPGGCALGVPREWTSQFDCAQFVPMPPLGGEDETGNSGLTWAS
jgi:hypothetical protein